MLTPPPAHPQQWPMAAADPVGDALRRRFVVPGLLGKRGAAGSSSVGGAVAGFEPSNGAHASPPTKLPRPAASQENAASQPLQQHTHSEHRPAGQLDGGSGLGEAHATPGPSDAAPRPAAAPATARPPLRPRLPGSGGLRRPSASTFVRPMSSTGNDASAPALHGAARAPVSGGRCLPTAEAQPQAESSYAAIMYTTRAKVRAGLAARRPAYVIIHAYVVTMGFCGTHCRHTWPWTV